MKKLSCQVALSLALLLAGLLAAPVTQAQSVVDHTPYTLFHDFETGEMFGWEPYPYQQDIAYDVLYFTRQSPTYNNSKYALARPVLANHVTELYQGFTRQLNFRTTEDTRLQVAVYFQSDRNPDFLEITLGTFDGKRYYHTIDEPKANRWLEIDVPLSGFQRKNGEVLGVGESIQVVTLKGSYQSVYYLYTYTMLMDDFQINGERQRRFIAEHPQSTDLDEFHKSILNRHYVYGETISLRTRPEGDVPLSRLTGRLVNGDGQVIRDNVSFTRREGAWENNSIHTIRTVDGRGRWALELSGERADGTRVEWAFDFLVPGEPLTSHPRLHFSREELNERMNRLSDDPVAQRILENALSDIGFMEVDVDAIEEGSNHITEALTHGPWSKISGHRMRYWWRPMIQLSDVIREGAFHYAFTGNREAGDKAKEAMLKLASFERWNVAWMLENQFWTYFLSAYTIMPIAYGYDMLYDLMSEEERFFVREALVEKGLKMFHRDMVEMNRMPSHATNHLSVLVTTYGMIATVLHGEDPDNPYMEPYLSGILEKLEGFVHGTYYEDGSYAEPIGYHGHATNTIVQAFDILERNFGLDYSTTTAVRNFYKMPIIGTGRTGQVQDFGDYHVSNPFDLGDTRSQWFVHRLGDPYLSHYVQQAWNEGSGGYFGFLWYRDDLDPLPRESLAKSRFFEARGMIMRSGWDDKATIIHNRTGPNANHYHYDQGSFQIQTNGQALLTDPGIGFGGYYGNLLFTPYNIQAIAHNVMLIDGDPQSQKPAHYDNGVMALRDWPRALHVFAGTIVDAIESDLATVYKDKLADYRRTLLYRKGGPLFLFDRVESVSPDGHTYNWAFHIPMGDRFTRIAEWNEKRLTVDREHARLTMDVLYPNSTNVTFEDNRDPRLPETLVRLDSEQGLTEANFLAVFYPEARPSNGRFGQRPTTEAVEAQGWVGARVTLGGQTDYGVFRTGRAGTGNLGQSDSDTAASSVAGFTTDATRFTASLDASGTLVRYYVEGSSFEGHGQSMSAGSPVSLAVLHHESGTDAEVDASGSTRVSFSVQSRPSRVTLDGSSVRYSYENGRVSLQVPAGRHDIKVR